MTVSANTGLNFLMKAALVLLVFQIGVFATVALKRGLGDVPTAYSMMILATALFVGSAPAIARVSRGAAGWLFASRTAVLALVAIGSLALAFRDYMRPPLPAITMQAVFSIMWAVIALKGAAVGKFKPGGRIGLCVYWTMHSRLAWERAHRVLGRVLFWGGLAGLGLSFVVSPPVSFALFVATLATGLALALVESWRSWRRDPDRTSRGGA
ncbi:MAG: hypothetical protein GC155_09635 [Alphaproteobacteria bacterium]|nr:hypothetical protein [Alphaproteobacteria bacterium]